MATFTSVGATNSLPIRPGGMNGGGFSIESRPLGEEVVEPVAWWTVVSPGFFETMGIALVDGRAMTEADGREEPLHVWVNERLAQDFLDGAALGERIQRGADGDRWWEIAGVVEDVRHFGPSEEVPHMIYFPLGPVTPPSSSLASMSVVVAHVGATGDAVEAVRDVVARLGPEVPITQAISMDEARRQAMADTSFTVALLAVAAAMALLLGAVGVYGVISYVVSQRTREIGLRMALGARAPEVQRMVVRQGMQVTLAGAALGLAAALGLTRLMGAILFEVSPTDPHTHALVPVVLVAVSALACWLPARRAARVDPVRALMSE